jgi:DNA-binding LacI/PurR family transcriptional regulator
VLALEEYKNADTVGWDVFGAAKSATSRLIAAGRRRVAHVSPRWILEDYPREQRRRGYTEAMTQAGLEPVIISAENESSDSAEVAMAAFLRESEPPDAVFGFLDNLAIGASRSMLNHGLTIPGDVWVCGFSDTPEAADFRVPLSSIRVPVEDLVERVWTWLMNRIESPDQESRISVLEMEFIQRDSTPFVS